MANLENWDWIDYKEIGSTNDAVRLLTNDTKGHRYVVTTKTQTGGRGRRGRSWVGLEGNLFMSQAVEIDLKNMGPVVFIVSLSLLEAIRKISPHIDIKLKWPNDVLVNSCKVSGILLEKGEGDYLIIGMGVNVKASPQIEGLIYPATSLNEAGIETTRLTVLKEYLQRFNANWQSWQEQGFVEIKQRWLADAKSLGEEIIVHTETEDKVGIFSGLDDNGILLLESGGKIEKIYAGDIFPSINSLS